MRICLLTTSTTAHRMGGTEVQAETLAAEAARQGHKVFVLTTEHPAGLKAERKDGYEVLYLEGTRHTMSRREAPAWWKASAGRTAQLCASEAVDVVWAENFSGLSYAAIPPSGRRPVVSIVNGLAVRGEVASNFNRVSSLSEALFFFTRYAAQTIFYYIPRFRAMVRDSDLLVGVSNETVEALEAEFPGSGKKAVAILNPVDTGFFRPDPGSRKSGRERLGFMTDEVVLLMSGVLHKQKGMHLGLKVFAGLSAEFPAARLVITGDGPEKARLEKLSVELGLSGKVAFCGMVPNSEMPVYYNLADIYLNPTLRIEGLPMVLIEAMSCGLPCVVSRIGGTGSSIEDGKCGFFTRPGDMDALSGKAGLLIGDSRLRLSFSAAARLRAIEVFDRERVIKKYLAASEELLKRF